MIDRTGKIAIALSVLGFVGWQIWYSAESEKLRKAQLTQQQEQLTSKASDAAGAPGEKAAEAVPKGQPAADTRSSVRLSDPSQAAREEKLQGAEAEWIFTNVGGGVQKVRLLKHLGEGGEVVLNEFGGIPLGALTEAFENPVLDAYAMEVKADQRAVVFRRTDPRQLEIEKEFSLGAAGAGGEKGSGVKSGFELQFQVRYVNRSSAPLTVPNYAVRLGSGVSLHAKDLPIYTGFNRLNGGASKFTDINWFSGGGFLGFGKKERSVYSDTGSITWAGITNQYYATILTPVGAVGSEALARRFEVSAADWKASGRKEAHSGALYAVDGALRMPVTTLAPGQEVVQRFSLYAGPREYRILSALGGEQEQMLDFGMFSLVSRTLLNSMNGLKSLLGSYAAAIVVLTLIIKSLMWPLQNRATASMKRMQELQPKMNELKQRYENDPQRMQVELMALYKKHGVNPMSGCLPMLIQIPIFFGFYNMLGKAVELRNSAFLWVKDLSQPDTVAMVAGFPLNVLPLLMAGTMVVQMRLTPKSGDPIQQRMFMLMPLIFVVFCYNFASALALYWTVQNLFSIAQLIWTNRQQAKGVQSAVATPARGK